MTAPSFAFVAAVVIPMALPATVPSAMAQVEWRQASVCTNKVFGAMAFDSARGRVVLFGGSTADGVTDETWEWDGTTWVQRSPSVAPAARNGHCLVYDGVRRRVLLFGGRSAAFTALNDTWEWDGTTWLQQAPAVRPPARYDCGLAADSVRSRVVLFGGRNNGLFSGALADTWEWDGTNWSPVVTTVSPPARLSHGLAFDSFRGRTLLFGGISSASTSLSDTWEWDGVTWLQRTPPTVPSGRSDFALTFDSLRGVAVLTGGTAISGPPLGDTWEWDGSVWLQRTASLDPLRRFGHKLAFDAVRGKAVLFGGIGQLRTTFPNDTSSTWGWDGLSWTELAPEASPGNSSNRGPDALAWDPVLQQVVCFNGPRSPMINEGWSWNGHVWNHLQPTTSPPARAGYALATDPLRNRIVLFGGRNSSIMLSDTWCWNGTTWLAQSPGANPSTRADCAVAWHGARSRVVLFGGNQGNYYLGDTWEWDGSTWTQRSTPTAPSPRVAEMAEDEARGVLVLFGGYGGGPLNDTWEWDGSNWALRLVVPPTASGDSMVYDRARRRVVLTGRSPTSQDETWEWDGTIWAQRLGPAAISSNGPMAFDPVRNRVVQYSRAFTWEYGPTHPASHMAFGAGCLGTAGIPQLSGVGLPWLGDTTTLSLTALPMNTAALVFVGRSSTDWSGVPLPQPLTSVGMPGCSLLVSVQLVLPAIVIGATGSLPLPIPTAVDLLGAPFFTQGFVLDMPANPLGLTASNATAGLIGGR